VITKNVPPYSIMTGNPARHAGWISQAGSKLDFDPQGLAICSQTGRRYKLENGIVDPAQ
jgi:UDP-2-acetamido-3-amino-2,3-dideoxy-glucuronate N-acetyltransferase